MSGESSISNPTGKNYFLDALNAAKSASPYAHGPAICIMRDYVFDKLHGEVVVSIAEFMPQRLVPLIEKLDLGRTPCFFYNGIVCVRAYSPFAPTYTFA